jgi:ferric-dicitrate binding protein FerR (iron transport regulator)
MRFAAFIAVVLLVASGIIWFSQGDRLNVRENLAITDDYGRTKIELADGSVVTLNNGSHLNYPDQFKGNFREVELEGEAFFEVQPNPEKPFIIHAGRADIQVLGTSFNVNAFPESGEIAVVVQTGKVQVSANDKEPADAAVVLVPGERGVLNDNAPGFTKALNTDPNFLAWKTHSFTFEKTSLEDVIQQLNKVYRVQIAAADPAMEKLLLTARFDDRPVRFILEIIAMTHNLDIEQIDDGGYLLTKK